MPSGLCFTLGLLSGFVLYRAVVLLNRWQRRQKAITEIHVEEYADISRLRAFCQSHPDVMLMLTPKSKAKELLDLLNPKGLHLHLADSSKKLPLHAQKQMIAQGLQQLKSYGHADIVDFAPGKWDYNEDTVKACKSLGLTRFHVYYTRGKLAGFVRKHGLKLILVERYMHDWDLLDYAEF